MPAATTEINPQQFRLTRHRSIVPRTDTDSARTAHLFDSRFWTSRFYASAAWTFNDSAATNIAAVGTAVATVLSIGDTLKAIFPNIDLSPFIIMNIACGGLIASAPLLFGIANVVFSRHYPMAPADATVKLTADASIAVPSGASITVLGGAKIGAPGKEFGVKAGGTIPAPPCSEITIKSGTILGLPGGTAVVIGPQGTLTMDTNTLIAASDLGSMQSPRRRGPRLFRREPQTRPVADTTVQAGTPITVITGATATVTGVADVRLPGGTTIVAPDHRGIQLEKDTPILVPSSSNMIAANMRSLLFAAALTTFAIGTEISLIATLAIHFSRANMDGHIAAWVMAVIVAAILTLYGATAIRALAEPTPGSSLSAGSATSFTL